MTHDISLLLEYFISGAIGAILFDLVSWKSENLSKLERKYRITSITIFYNLVFILISLCYSIFVGGVIGLIVDNNYIVSFVGGFLSQTVLSTIVKTLKTRSFTIAVNELFVNLLKHYYVKLEEYENAKNSGKE